MDNSFKFQPDTELIDFATDFSNTYRKLVTGEYYSKEKKYKIDYVDKIKNTKTGVRISLKSGIIEVDKSVMTKEEFTPDFMFFMIMLCIIAKETGSFDFIFLDKITLDFCSEAGFFKSNIIICLNKYFMENPSGLNIRRLKTILKQHPKKIKK